MKKVILLGLALIVGVALVYNNWKHKPQDEQQVQSTPATAPEEPASPVKPAEPAVRFPVPETQPPESDQASSEQESSQVHPLPPLDQSDDEMRDLLVGLVGQETFMDLFDLKDMIRHIVATVDNLPRSQYATKFLPTKPVAGRFVVTGNEEHKFISTANYQRYTPYVKLMESLDEKTVVAMYTRLYPLFQEAYVNLGYPSGYFNDRLIDVIDNLLDTPEKKALVEVVQPHVLYEYADEELEELSAGQKILIRMGNDNADAVKAKLRSFRQELTALSNAD